MTIQSEASRLPAEWSTALRRRGCDVGRIEELVASIYDGAAPGSVLPQRSDVFRAFHLTTLTDVRVVILGQDPYPRPDQKAQGLAFSVPSGVEPPRSLKAIFSNLVRDPDVDFSWPATGDLTEWARRGVLLLNTALTVQAPVPDSHRARWTDFTDAVLSLVNDESDHVVFLLWGRRAIDRGTAIPIGDAHKVIRSAHPAARGRSREQRFKDVRHFSQANAFLTAHHPEAVNWNIADRH